MKNSKIFRWLCALLSVVFLFSLVSCSNDGDDGEANTSPIVYNVDYVYTKEELEHVTSDGTSLYYRTISRVVFFENGQLRETKYTSSDTTGFNTTEYSHGWWLICDEEEETYIGLLILPATQGSTDPEYWILDIVEEGRVLKAHSYEQYYYLAE